MRAPRFVLRLVVPRAPVAALAVLSVGACRERALTSPRGQFGPPLAIVGGARVADTIQAQPLQALVVEVRHRDGLPAHGVVVRFESLPDGGGGTPLRVRAYVDSLSGTTFGTFTANRTDSAGVAAVRIALGDQVGPGKIAITVPELALEDTARYTVVAGNAVRLTMRIRDTALYVGAGYAIGASATDRLGNLRPNDVVTYVATTTNVAVTDSGVVSASAIGRGAIAVHAGEIVDSAYVSVVPHGALVYVQQTSPRGIAIINLDRSGYRFLHAVTDYSMYPQWSPDGTSIVAYEGNPDGNARLTITGIDSTSRTVLQIPVDSLVGLAWPRFAPDGTIYFGGVMAGVGPVVWQVHADGTGLRAVPNALGSYGFQHPVVSPDGRTLLYDDAQYTSALATLDLATGTTTSLGSGTWPAYSPDGSEIAFISQGSVMIADASGANPRTIATAVMGLQDAVGPSWTSDGQWVLIPADPSLLVRVSDLQVLPLPYTAGFFQPTVR